MHALLTHPAIQAVLAPFLLALLTAELLQRLRLSGLAIIAGFSITVFLIGGISYGLHSGAQKIVWLGIAAALLSIPLSLVNWSLWRPVLAVLAASAGRHSDQLTRLSRMDSKAAAIPSQTIFCAPLCRP